MGAGVLLICYSIVGGFLLPVPDLPVLRGTIRMLYLHVPMWFTMLWLLLLSCVMSVSYLKSRREQRAVFAVELVKTGIFFGVLGLITGMLWARYTWGAWWHFDPKQNASAATLVLYGVYLLVYRGVPEGEFRWRVLSVYNVLAFVLAVLLIFVFPRLTDSLHPGAGGNPAFNIYDLHGTMRLVFYPAVVGWLALGTCLANLSFRLVWLRHKQLVSVSG